MPTDARAVKWCIRTALIGSVAPCGSLWELHHQMDDKTLLLTANRSFVTPKWGVGSVTLLVATSINLLAFHGSNGVARLGAIDKAHWDIRQSQKAAGQGMCSTCNWIASIYFKVLFLFNYRSPNLYDFLSIFPITAVFPFLNALQEYLSFRLFIYRIWYRHSNWPNFQRIPGSRRELENVAPN